MSGMKKDGVEATLRIPLWSRAVALKKLPDILPDYDAPRILKEMGEKRPPTILYELECAALAGAMRQYDLAWETREYLEEHPAAAVVELGAGLSCLRRQMDNRDNPWINIDLEEVISLRERHIPAGPLEKNVSHDITDHGWFDEVPFDKDKGIIFLAAGVLHYLSYDDVRNLIKAMAECFPGGLFVFDYISRKGLSSGNTQIRMTDNSARMSFYMDDACKEMMAMSDRIVKVIKKSYLEGYPTQRTSYSLLTRLYVRSKRDKYFVAHVEFE